MLLWFVALAPVLVWQVLRDPAIDNRLVVAGVLLPDVVDGITFRGAGVLHTIVGNALLLGIVMAGTAGRPALRKRALAVPIGCMVHMLLDGVWGRAKVFWWPLFGSSTLEGQPLPSFDRPVLVLLAMEIAGAAALVWAVRNGVFRRRRPMRP